MCLIIALLFALHCIALLVLGGIFAREKKEKEIAPEDFPHEKQ